MSTYSIFLFAFSLFFLPFFSHFNICLALESEEEENYSYDENTGRGPSRWGELNPSWYRCGNGTSQSPIDISRLSEQLSPDLAALHTHYKPAQATLINKGHDILVQWNEDAGDLNISGVEYKLLQSHWHTPSEHKINGRRFDAELHAVHKNSLGEIAVLGILFTSGPPNPLLSKVYDQIRSLENNKTGEIGLGIINPYEIGFENNSSYYRYNGSLTTPPCDEGVLWTLLEQVQTVSFGQIKALKDAVKDGYEENARPTQPINGRTVDQYPRSHF
ncbi:alpha carbonic anhydrase 4-like isoform X1 [Humulus lupulus]|uniref:alpha carbonic anhydrase 4-like isoform X1 n=1 Tax=Humulus lupulus TaxID=3486 RepID=UPI002B416808|nr:alpha carbonic anhydrase 4-like isoform X1 [Humulus lupulus]